MQQLYDLTSFKGSDYWNCERRFDISNSKDNGRQLWWEFGDVHSKIYGFKHSGLAYNKPFVLTNEHISKK